jgi:hypothetical protein
VVLDGDAGGRLYERRDAALSERRKFMRLDPVREIRGVGDRWLAGEKIEGVEFALHARVRITEGRHAGKTGIVAFLMNLDDDPMYLVELTAGTGDVRVRETALKGIP